MDERESQPAAESDGRHTFFDVYKVAIEDLHATRDLGQKIDSFYLTILTLLLTADAYEIATATAHLDTWTPVLLTAGVMVIGITVTSRWRLGARNLYDIVTYRYEWLREAEKGEEHPEMKGLGANMFTQEYKRIYVKPTTFYYRTVALQGLCTAILVAVPLFIGVPTYFNLYPGVLPVALQAIQHAIP